MRHNTRIIVGNADNDLDGVGAGFFCQPIRQEALAVS